MPANGVRDAIPIERDAIPIKRDAIPTRARRYPDEERPTLWVFGGTLCHCLREPQSKLRVASCAVLDLVGRDDLKPLQLAHSTG